MDRGSDEEEDDGSTVLIDSGDDLYDSDVTEIEISDDEEDEVVEIQSAQPQSREPTPSQQGNAIDHTEQSESQSDNESVLLIPAQTGSNQTVTSVDQHTRLDRPGTSSSQTATGFNQPGLDSARNNPGFTSMSQHAHDPRTSQSAHSSRDQVHSNQSSMQGHVNQSATRNAGSSQSQLRTAANSNQSGAANHVQEARPGSSSQTTRTQQSGNPSEAGNIEFNQRIESVPSQRNNQNLEGNRSQEVIEIQRTAISQSANRIQEQADQRQEPANQDAPEEEPMEGVVSEEETLPSSNDSFCDFQEPKKSAAASAKTADDSISDDESQSCIICYESWTTSGSHRLVSLRCGHLFGQSCIEQWLKGQGGKCPQCNSKAKRSDIRVIYAKALKALDTSERDRAMKDLEREKELRKKAEMDAAQTQLRYVMAMEEVKRMKAMLEAQQKSATRNMFSSGVSSSSQASVDSLSSGRYVLDRTIQVSPNGNCRVVGFDYANQLLLASMQSANNLFQGYGLKKISAMDFKTNQYIPIHSKPIRGLASNGRNDGLLLTASVDKQLKITSLSSNTVVQSYTCPMPAWCCTWNSANTNYIYAGLQNGAIVIYDTRKSDGEVQTLTKDGSRCPIVSLKYVPSSTSLSFACSGLLVGTLEGASFWEQLAAEEYRLHALQLEGSCTGVNFEPNTRHCLASFRPNKTHPATRHIMCEMRRQQVGDHGNSLVSTNTVQTFYGGSTMKLLTQSAIFPSPNDEGKLIVCAGDEASSSIHTWDASTGCVRQKIQIGATALDVCPFSVGDASYLASLTDKHIKLCKWVES